MPKRPVPSCGRSPRCTRQTRLVSPHPPSNRLLSATPNVACAQTLFSTPIASKPDIEDNRVDASIYSNAQLSWFQAYDIQRFHACLDFARCDDTLLRSIFPSKYGCSTRIPLSHRHTAVAIREFQKLGNIQQLRLLEQDIASPSPLIPELNTYPCLGLRIQYLVQTVSDENRRQSILDGYAHLIREAINTC